MIRSISLVFLCVVSFHSIYAQQKDNDVDAYRKEIFPDSKKSACMQLSRGLKAPKKDPLKIWDDVSTIINALQKGDADTLVNMFHPRMGISKPQVQKLLDETSFIYGSPLTYSPLRVWAINAADGKPDLVPCFEDELALGALYGYELQFGVWVQVSGQKDLARLYFSLVPGKDRKWQIGTWNNQQWTYQSKDPDTLVKEALDKKYDEAPRLQRFILLDLAAKLLNGGGHLFLKKQEDVIATREDAFKTSEVLTYFQKLSPKLKLVSVGTIFAPENPGFIFRFEVKPDVKVAELEGMCLSELQAIYGKIDNSQLGASRCSFLLPGEDISRDGHLGSRLIRRSKILPIEKKPQKT